MNYAKWSLMLNSINSISSTLPARFIFFNVFIIINFFKWVTLARKTHLGISMRNSVRKLAWRVEKLFFTLCSKSWSYNLVLDQGNNFYLISLNIFISCLLFNVGISQGEVSCWSLLGVKGLIRFLKSREKSLLAESSPGVPITITNTNH